jgi:bacillopeptidase F
MIVSFISSCTPPEDDTLSSSLKNCENNSDCKRDEFCDFNNPIFNDSTGKETYKCEKRDVCSSDAECQFGWVCCKSEQFCVTKEEYEKNKLECENKSDNSSDTDNVVSNDFIKNDTVDNSDIDEKVEAKNDNDIVNDKDSVQPQPDQDTNLGTPLFTESFENGSSKWAMDGVWQVGIPTSGPSKARTGSNVVATNLSGNYGENNIARLTYLPEINVTSTSKLVFYAYVNTEYNLYDPQDFMEIQIKDSSGIWQEGKIKLTTDIAKQHKLLDMSFTKVNGYVDDNYHRFIADLSSFKGKKISISFLFKSDETTFAPGIYLDDISLY